MLFSDRSFWTMMHGIVLGGAAMLALFAALFAMNAAYALDAAAAVRDHQSRSVARLVVFGTVMLWVTVLSGTYVVFPPYRAAPPEGLTDLARYPRSLLLANSETAWLHTFAMESKEHMPWIAAMLATAAAFVAVRYRPALGTDPVLRRTVLALLGMCFTLVSFTAVMGILVNKAAPLE
jgi:hypothetical protein